MHHHRPARICAAAAGTTDAVTTDDGRRLRQTTDTAHAHATKHRALFGVFGPDR